MGAKTERARFTGEAVNKSRNERQKSVLLVEVARQVCATSADLIQRTKQLLADTKRLQEEIRAENRKR